MRTELCATLVLLGLLSACGAAPAPGEGAQEGVAPESTVTVIDTLNAEGMQYTFIGTDQGAGIDIVGPESAGRPAVFRLMDQYGELTTLEYYLALAPQGATPDPLLLAAHEREARALGRPDSAVREVSLEPLPVTEKATLQNCKNWASTQRGGFLNNTIGNTFPDDATLSMALGTATTTTIAAVVCNTTHSGSDSGLAANVEMKTTTTDFTIVGSTSDTGNVFVLPSTANANSNNTYTHIQGPAAGIRRLRINGFFLGAGHNYYMAIAF